MAEIFSESFFRSTAFSMWEAHLDWLASLGFARATERVEPDSLPVFNRSGHEVVDLLADFIAETGLINAHLGLTSSDIVDNVRLFQVQQALVEVQDAISELTKTFDIRTDSDNDLTVAYTHWQPAAPISWTHRLGAWMSPLNHLVATTPAMYAKKWGGAVGDQAALALVVSSQAIHDNPFNWEAFDLMHPNNGFPLQSTDWHSEMRAFAWVNAVAAQLHKISNDLRFLSGLGVVKINRAPHHAGSSSMPHKTNPIKWEKVCGICRHVSAGCDQLWAIAAGNGLERTLDGSWQFKALLPQVFGGIANAIQTFQSVDAEIDPSVDAQIWNRYSPDILSERSLTLRVIQGEQRWTAYLDLIAQQNQKQST